MEYKCAEFHVGTDVIATRAYLLYIILLGQAGGFKWVIELLRQPEIIRVQERYPPPLG